MKKLVFGLLSLTLLASACKKSNDAPADLEIKKENVVGIYVMTAYTGQVTGGPVDDGYADMQPCEKDDTYEFKSDNSFLMDDAGAQCNGGGVWTNTYTLEGSYIAFYNIAGTITKLTTAEMEITYVMPNGDGTSTTLKWTFKRL